MEARNQTEALVHQVESSLTEAGDKVGPQEKGEAEAAVAAARSALEGNDEAGIKQAGERLSQAAMKLGEAMYKAQSAEPGAQPGPDAQPGGAAPDEKVVDAEFEEVDEKRKSA